MRTFSEWIVEREMILTEQLLLIEEELKEKGKSMNLAKKVGMLLLSLGVGIWADLGSRAYEDYLDKYSRGEYGKPNTEILAQLHHKGEEIKKAEEKLEAEKEMQGEAQPEEAPSAQGTYYPPAEQQIKAGPARNNACPIGGGKRVGPIRRFLGCR
jgi:hypothetical protein